MPPQTKLARTAILGAAARGHAMPRIIRWTCNPPPSVQQTLAALARLKGPVYAASIIGGIGKGSSRRAAPRARA